MRITNTMDLEQLANHMGTDATISQAASMQMVLIESGYDGWDTTEIFDQDWEQALIDIVKAEMGEI